MADSPEPEAKRPCKSVRILHPLKSVGNLQERYTEDTADVFFVEKETKERRPAHREVLKVASPVFHKMFSGDWKEKDEKEIPAPEDFSWESFKAAITLLYGEEVEVEESVIPDLYRVAHYYDLRAVISAFAQTIQVWDHHQLSTVVELCTLAGQVEAEQKQEENEVIQAAIRYIAQHLEMIRGPSVDITGLSYQTMLMLVQCEHITAEEEDVLITLNQWMDANPEVSMGKAQELFSHIRYGTLPFLCLLQCRVGQSNLDMAFDNHYRLSIDRLKDNLSQITPRKGQKEVLQVYPMAAVLAQSMQEEVIKYFGSSASPAVALVYSGKKETIYELSLQFTAPNALTAESFLDCQLRSLTDGVESDRREVRLRDMDGTRWTGKHAEFKLILLVVNDNGCCLRLYADTERHGKAIARTEDVYFEASFPWLLTFGVRGVNGIYSFMFDHPLF